MKANCLKSGPAGLTLEYAADCLLALAMAAQFLMVIPAALRAFGSPVPAGSLHVTAGAAVLLPAAAAAVLTAVRRYNRRFFRSGIISLKCAGVINVRLYKLWLLLLRASAVGAAVTVQRAEQDAPALYWILSGLLIIIPVLGYAVLLYQIRKRPGC